MPVEDMAMTKAQFLCHILEDKLLTQKVTQFKSLTYLLNYNLYQNTHAILDNWLDENQEFLSVIYYFVDTGEMTRSVQKTLWSKEEILDLSTEKRQDLFQYLLRKSVFTDENNTWSVGEIYPDDILGYPILSVLIPFENKNGKQVMEGKFIIKNTEHLLEHHISSKEYVGVNDNKNHLLFQWSQAMQHHFPITEQIGIRWFTNGISVTIPFTRLPWQLNFQKEVMIDNNRNAWFQKYVLYFIVGGLVFVLLFGFILSHWIDIPLKKFISQVTEIGRGKFHNQIPEQKNIEIQKLAKIFNYMAEEMDHLQKINVSEIINEKIKTETIIRNIADGIIVTDAKDRILVMNSVAEGWFDIKEKEAVHKPLKSCLKIEPLILLIQKVKEGQSKAIEEFTYRSIGDRKAKIFDAHASRVKGKEENIIGIVTIIRDVTKEREADRLKTDLVSMVAHELKSPLTSIFGFSELLLESNLKDVQANEYAQVIQTESSRLTELINKFLDLSKLEAGRTEIRMSPFDLKQVIDRVLETLRLQTEEKEMRTIVDIPDNFAFAYGDQDMIEQVIQNLYSNAIKYSPKRSKIGIEVKRNQKEVIVNVIDNGYGIEKDALPKIFDKFYRVVDSEASDEIEGSGLGLALCREIIERHGGVISVKSRLGVGSVFTFTLPDNNATEIE